MILTHQLLYLISPEAASPFIGMRAPGSLASSCPWKDVVLGISRSGQINCMISPVCYVFFQFFSRVKLPNFPGSYPTKKKKKKSRYPGILIIVPSSSEEPPDCLPTRTNTPPRLLSISSTFLALFPQAYVPYSIALGLPLTWFLLPPPTAMVGISNRVESFPDVADLESALPPSTIPPLEIHSVSLPQKKTTIQSLKRELNEVFFPDDPLHQFKNQPFFRKVILGLQYVFPIFQWASEYRLNLLKADVVSGLTIASLAIPQVCKLNLPSRPF